MSNFLKRLLEEMKAVTELDEGEDRDVILNTVDVISYIGKIDFYEYFIREIYEALDKNLRKCIEYRGIKKVKTELNYKNYMFEINKLKINLNTAREKIEKIEGETYSLIYTYKDCGHMKEINDMIIYVK